MTFSLVHIIFAALSGMSFGFSFAAVILGGRRK